MKELDKNISVEVDRAEEGTWNDIVKLFNDANIYQTWAYGEVRHGRSNISHLVLKKAGKIIAAAQARIVKVPILNIGIAYVRWGPLWKIKGEDSDIALFQQVLRALRNEYACRRGYVIRIYPALFDDEQDTYLSVLEEEGYKYLEEGKKDRTLLVDLKPPLAELRKGLAQKWRNSLNKAEKNGIELIEGSDDVLFDTFIGVYREMLERKKFSEPNDINEFKLIQSKLPEEYKMQIMLCKYEGNIGAGSIFSAMGDTGLYLFGATNDAGTKSNGSYLMQWKFMEWLSGMNYQCYDLNGINPEVNPGTYKFKEGLCGKNGKDVYFMGQYEACDSELSKRLVGFGEKLKKYMESKQ